MWRVNRRVPKLCWMWCNRNCKLKCMVLDQSCAESPNWSEGARPKLCRISIQDKFFNTLLQYSIDLCRLFTKHGEWSRVKVKSSIWYPAIIWFFEGWFWFIIRPSVRHTRQSKYKTVPIFRVWDGGFHKLTTKNKSSWKISNSAVVGSWNFKTTMKLTYNDMRLVYVYTM